MDISSLLYFETYVNIYTWSVIAFVAFYAIILFNRQDEITLPAVPYSHYFFLLILILAIAFCPYTLFSDKHVYLMGFEQAKEHGMLSFKDVGWDFYTYLASTVLNGTGYFVLTAFIYVTGFYYFSSIVAENYRFPLFLLFVSFFLFFGYGTNTMRSGMACALAFVAITQFDDRRWLFWCLAFVACTLHLTMFLPLAAFVVSCYYPRIRFAFYIWIFCVVLSATMGDFFQVRLEALVGSRAQVIAVDQSAYKSGFRIDFILYSLVPIVVGYYQIFRNGFDDVFYKRIYMTYLMANGFWILVIRANFTDRIAFLSWIFYPVLLAYPFIYGDFEPRRCHRYIAICLFGQAAFMALMSML